MTVLLSSLHPLLPSTLNKTEKPVLDWMECRYVSTRDLVGTRNLGYLYITTTWISPVMCIPKLKLLSPLDGNGSLLFLLCVVDLKIFMVAISRHEMLICFSILSHSHAASCLQNFVYSLFTTNNGTWCPLLITACHILYNPRQHHLHMCLQFECSCYKQDLASSAVTQLAAVRSSLCGSSMEAVTSLVLTYLHSIVNPVLHSWFSCELNCTPTSSKHFTE